MQRSRFGAWGAIVTIALVTILLGCAARAHDAADSSGPQRDATIEVTNQGWSDVVMYVIRGRSRLRLGMVTSNGRAIFALRRAIVPEAGQVQLLARPIGGREYLMPSVHVSAGQRVSVTLEEPVTMSSISVWEP